MLEVVSVKSRIQVFVTLGCLVFCGKIGNLDFSGKLGTVMIPELETAMDGVESRREGLFARACRRLPTPCEGFAPCPNNQNRPF